MRKIMMPVCMALFLFSVCTGAMAQDDPMQDSYTAVKELPPITVKSSSEVKKKLNAVFARTFPDAKELKWYNVDRDYLARFISNDMQHNALFSAKGVLKYAIAYGFEQHLPTHVQYDVKNTYPKSKISHVYHLTVNNRDIWFAVLDNGKQQFRLKMENGEMEEVERLEKEAE